MFDTHTFALVIGTALAGGVLGLDRTAAGQIMISQPIVAAPLTGWALGDVTAGLVIGAVLELIWILDMPIGTFVPADSTVSAVSATAIASIGSPGGAPLPALGFSLLLTTALAPITMLLDGVVRKWNSKLADAAVAATGDDGGRRLARAHLAGLGGFFLKSFVLYLVVLPAGLAAMVLFDRMPGQVHRAMSLFVKLLPLLGAALVVRRLSIRTLDLFFIVGFASAAVFGQAFHLPVLFLTVCSIAVGWLGVRCRG